MLMEEQPPQSRHIVLSGHLPSLFRVSVARILGWPVADAVLYERRVIVCVVRKGERSQRGSTRWREHSR